MKLGWILLGTAAVGGVGYYLYTRKTSSTPATPPAGTTAGSIGPAPAGANNYQGNPFAQKALAALSSGVSADGTLISATDNAASTSRAITLMGIGHGDREGLYWALIVAGNGGTPDELNRLRAAGYKV
jgi:hypothetical protein